LKFGAIMNYYKIFHRQGEKQRLYVGFADF